LNLGNGATENNISEHDLPVVQGHWTTTIPENDITCNTYHVAVYGRDTSGYSWTIADGAFEGSCAYGAGH
jgi:hypothetical protein